MALPSALSERIAKEDADLRVVSLQKLMDGDDSANDDLLKACTDLGFFYLDCRHVASGRVMQEVQDMYSLATSFYDLPQEAKSEWLVDRDHDEHLVMGYKPAGHGNGPVEGKKDGFEGLMLFEHPISKISDPSLFPGPDVISSQLLALKQAMSSFREMSVLLLARISEALGLDTSKAYQQYHRKNAVCPTALGLLKYTLAEVEPDKVGQIAHSDAGSLSIVFTEVAGLQVLKPNEETWYYIAPKPGHAVVNVGDALRFISGGVLESSLHRIIPHKDEMGRHKYSIVYLLRPEMDAEFTDAEGVVWKGLDWTNKKHAVFRASAEEQSKGGSSGIGLAAAKILASKGSKVLLLDIFEPEENLPELIRFRKCDVSQWLDLRNAFADVGPVHIAVANAGRGEDGTYLTDSYDDEGNLLEPNYDVISVNLRGVLNFVKLALNNMKTNGIQGSVVITSSATAYAAEQSLPVYCGTKAALINYMRAMRSTLRDAGITINTVAPAATITKLLPADLAAPIMAAGLPVSSAHFVGLAIVHSATALEPKKVQNLLEDMSLEEGSAYNERLISLSKGKAEPDRAVPVEWITYELWNDMRSCDKVLADAILEPVFTFMRAQTDKSRLSINELGHYLNYRERDVGKALLSALMRFSMKLHLSPEQLHSVHEIEMNCSKHISVVNDIYSWEKELLASQNGHEEGSALCSSVSVLSSETNLHFSASKRILWVMCREWELVHEDLVKRRLESQIACSSDLRAFMKGLEYQMSGNEAWSESTPRYHSV
ncbi:hypothetical protein CkaCkLH20_11965 [Colletotrichum karsti]|uniref:Fe2OG dioxygenase domain-containing protein n=1 Tax=Colletotrichum karsti TaxID=1095194 RepID=A0A9P6LD32_9PEZI|nr:uncharacterized protein CkaCkLH20_11965 [Colletotrichum karsti]KAF9870659.1 hypothetical protein CkaCkLH20_11965 [Colletotrichum karsti]